MSKRSDIRKRPPALPKSDPYQPLFSPAKYFSEPHMVVRRGEMQVVIASLERARRAKTWYRRFWRWLMSPFVKPPVHPVVAEVAKQESKRAHIDASGKVVQLPDEKQADPTLTKSSIEIASR